MYIVIHTYTYEQMRTNVSEKRFLASSSPPLLTPTCALYCSGHYAARSHRNKGTLTQTDTSERHHPVWMRQKPHTGRKLHFYLEIHSC